jgi:voltage-gated potassium channel
MALILKERRRVYRWTWAVRGLLLFILIWILLLGPAQYLSVENNIRVSQSLTEFTLVDAIYWIIITFTTVGYGDISPVTLVGRSIAAINALAGVLVMGVIAGLLLTVITPRRLS